MNELTSTPNAPGIVNSDMHLYVTYTNEPDSSNLAWAGPCQRRNDRPIVGRVNFNIGKMQNLKGTNKEFED